MAFKIETNIPYGNACDISILENGKTAEISFTPDPHGGPECLWFCFRLIQTTSSDSIESIKLVLKNSQNMLGGGNPKNMRPVIRYADSDWRRLDAPTVKALPDGRNLVIWVIDAPKTFAEVAYCYPYGRSDVENLVNETDGYWKMDTIGVSQAGRPLIRLCNSYGNSGSDIPGLYLAARQHSGESSGSWVLDGFLRHIASLGDDAPMIWAIPLTNIDGVENGDYGKDNFPYDLNRAWGSPPMRHEALVFQRDIHRWRERCRPALCIDFHAPGACESNGIYCFLPNPEKLPEYHKSVLEMINRVAEILTPKYAAEPFGRVARYASRWETPTFAVYCMTNLKVPAFTIENPYAMVGDMPLAREHYQEAGRLIASSIIEQI